MKHWLVLLLAGSAVFLVGQRTQAESSLLPPAAPRAYLCFEGHGASDITQKANEAGARGWKMISAVSRGDSSIWCFEQYQAMRPAGR